jgi:glucose/arabinose dehydrogenase
MKSFISLLCSVCLLSLTACAQEIPNQVKEPKTIDFSVETVIDSIASPWGMVFLKDGSMLVTDRKGDIIHFKEGKKQKVKNVPEAYVRGQGGLLDLELHPNYKENGWIYMTYASPEGEGKGGNTALVRFKLENETITHLEKLYKASPNTTKGQHFGSRIEFDNKGYLFFSAGERGEREVNPQDIRRDNGKIYRLNDDGSIPADNPFVGVEGAREAIYSYGHRNPQGMFFHPVRKELWAHEHGPKGGDEINIIKKGANYGWVVITYGINYSGTPITDLREKEGMEQPIHFWVPSIAPSGVCYVTSDKYPNWKGNLLVGSLSFQYLERLELDDTKVVYREKLLGGIGRVRNVRQGPDGYIYVGVEGKGILRLVPKTN